MHLFLARHGETDWNVERRIQGWGNSKLTQKGLDQIALLGNRLSTIPITVVYSSDAERARETALAIVGERDIPLIVVAELRETSWGRWEGKTAAEISAAEPELWAKFVNRDHQAPPDDQADWESTTFVPGGEPILHASRRINGAIERIVSHHQESNDSVVIVGHGGSLRFVIADILGLKPSSARLFHLDNASLTHVEIEPNRKVVKLINDSSHWSGPLAL